MDATTVEAELLRTLGIWGLGSLAAGSLVWAGGKRCKCPGVAAFGRQNAAWGAVDGAIAAGGSIRLARKAAPASAATAPDTVGDTRPSTQPGRRLRRTLLINAGLDIGYLLLGAGLILRRQQIGRLPRYSAAHSLGDGAAIVLQGGFLLWLDLSHAVRLDT